MPSRSDHADVVDGGAPIGARAVSGTDELVAGLDDAGEFEVAQVALDITAVQSHILCQALQGGEGIAALGVRIICKTQEHMAGGLALDALLLNSPRNRLNAQRLTPEAPRRR